jgi:hypothetical protein
MEPHMLDTWCFRSSTALALVVLLVAAGPLAGTFAFHAEVVEAAGFCNSPYNPGVSATNFKDTNGKPFAIDNPYFPLNPGTTWVYEGTTKDGFEHNTVRVTNQKKTIQGVTATVVLDEVTVDGVLAERTFDWYAQDSAGNVWYLGEDSKEYDAQGNVISTAGSWVWDPRNGVFPGIIMEAHSAVGDTYRQEYAPRVAEDAAEVESLTAQVSVPAGTYSNVLQTRDFSCLTGGSEDKYYAPNVGQVLTIEKGNSRVELMSKSGG